MKYHYLRMLVINNRLLDHRSRYLIEECREGSKFKEGYKKQFKLSKMIELLIESFRSDSSLYSSNNKIIPPTFSSLRKRKQIITVSIYPLYLSCIGLFFDNFSEKFLKVTIEKPKSN